MNAQAQVAPNVGEQLLAAFPQHVVRVEGGDVVLKSGQRITIDQRRAHADHEAMLANADIKDMFVQRYVPGRPQGVPLKNDDPGRARNAALFNAIYGDCTKGEVTRHLVDVPWVPKKGGKPVKFSNLNGAAQRLAAVSRELDQLPARFDKYLVPSAGTYVCRPIAGTTRVSAHGHGIAIDIAIAETDYWRWAGGAATYRNKIPFEIVEIFERHGFIWGGKWYHFDTMHFEYRPELLPPTAPLE
jgi:hypothetical protein